MSCGQGSHPYVIRDHRNRIVGLGKVQLGRAVLAIYSD